MKIDRYKIEVILSSLVIYESIYLIIHIRSIYNAKNEYDK